MKRPQRIFVLSICFILLVAYFTGLPRLPTSHVVNADRCHPFEVFKKLYANITIQLQHRKGNQTTDESLHFFQIQNLPGGYNNARYNDIDECVTPCLYNPGKIILVTNVIDYNDAEYWNKPLEFEGRRSTIRENAMRWVEITNTLQRNLNHDQIKAIATLVEREAVAEKIRKLDLQNSQKLIIQKSKFILTMASTFEYATRCFPNRTVAIANQDNAFGSGWDRIDVAHLQKTLSMYALTRHTSILNPYCYHVSTSLCIDSYIGSHDVYVFHVKKHISLDNFPALKKNEFSTYGVENVVIWTFQNSFKYRVTNPCGILQVHHEHCVGIRSGSRVRVNNENNTGLAPPTKTLY